MSDYKKLEKLAGNFDYWCEKPLEVIAKAAKKTKENKKHDPKASLRNRGKCVFPAGSSKVNDDKDHYPINSEKQGRAALSYAGKQKSAPWYNGTVEEMRKAVQRAVHKAFPNIGKEEKKKTKKSSLEMIVEKYGTNETPSITKTANPQAFYNIINNYEGSADCVRDFAQAMKLSAESFARESDAENDPKDCSIYDLLLKAANVVSETLPKLEVLDQEMQKVWDTPTQQEEI